MKPQVGQRLGSVTSEIEVIVVRPPADDVDLTCGGAPMAPAPAERSGEPDAGGGALLGKRYHHVASGMELLCTKAGAGTLAVDGEPLGVKEAKNLPSSD
ncbi:hypothetical protein [Aeromicrobium ginsengisoli]|uniref:Uncharacterized protein n=1 Tax=Aeromicrobium ginsengisoli TaxID=363867 RepID=A0A5M4F920_9ACTN|nr:hypothetical protein [Aeromicrobium ginsengisoli]KAA1394270.1 hypothetical protein ESP70_018890 [Aeromicrobium ginsengisoli]